MYRFAAPFLLLAVSCAAAGMNPASAHAVLNQYCVACHSEKAKTAGVVLERLDLANVGQCADVLEKVLRKVRTGEMPPAGLPRPAAPVYADLASWLEKSLDSEAAAHPNPGRPVIHRLNRAEYSNTIRDLLALDINPGALLPVDDSGHGFDNIADVLSVSPALLERYMSVSRLVSRLAIGDLNMKSLQEEFSARRSNRNERVSEDLPFDSRGGVAAHYYFPLDAEYAIRVKLAGDPPPPNSTYEVRIPVKAGLRVVGAAFLRESARPELEAPLAKRAAPAFGLQPPKPIFPAEMDLRLDGARLKLFDVPQTGAPPQIGKLLIEGPFNPTGRGDTPSRARIFVCRPPAGGKDDEPCARLILATMARRAFRRPVNDADLKPLLAFYRGARREGDFDHGIEKAIRAMLVSPDFLFRMEKDPNGSPDTAHRVGDYELASRLSFFVWSSIPDDELLDLAERGKLHDPATLNQQVRRMLDDPRSQALVSNFAGQWLYLRNLQTVKPDPDAFPEFDESLRQAFERETSLFFQTILREDRSILELLDANYTFLNQRLAEHYGIPNVYGSQFRQIALTDPNRGGLLGQGSVLTVTSYPNRTSVVQRGKWILETLLGTPPPPKPPDVPDLEPRGKDGRVLPLREALEEHRANPTCAGCHARMDPLGFALENYDGVGKYRTKDAGQAIDATGKLPDGEKFEGPAGLKKLLLTAHRDEFVATVTDQLLTYALGRGLESYDKPVVRSIARDAAREDYRFSALVTAVVNSTPFQMRRMQEQ